MENVSGNVGVVRGNTVRDDRIFPEVRWIGGIIVLVLIAAFIILYLLPERVGSEDIFSWRINPQMTPLMMGAGYISGAWFFARLFFDKKWHHVGWGFLAITTFVWFMGLSTVLHIDKFNSSISFYAWGLLYAVTPFLIPILWLRNRTTDPGTPDPDDVVVPQWIRQVTLVVGVGLGAIGLLMFIFPTFFISFWPWTLTPLTARVIGGWFALPAVVGLALPQDSRWSSWRIMIESQMIALVLIPIAVFRVLGTKVTVGTQTLSNPQPDNPMTWLFVGGLVLLLAGGTALYFSMESQRRKTTA
jgi:uncharacterized membrane protein